MQPYNYFACSRLKEYIQIFSRFIDHNRAESMKCWKYMPQCIDFDYTLSSPNHRREVIPSKELTSLIFHVEIFQYTSRIINWMHQNQAIFNEGMEVLTKWKKRNKRKFALTKTNIYHW